MCTWDRGSYVIGDYIPVDDSANLILILDLVIIQCTSNIELRVRPTNA